MQPHTQEHKRFRPGTVQARVWRDEPTCQCNKEDLVEGTRGAAHAVPNTLGHGAHGGSSIIQWICLAAICFDGLSALR